MGIKRTLIVPMPVNQDHSRRARDNERGPGSRKKRENNTGSDLDINKTAVR